MKTPLRTAAHLVLALLAISGIASAQTQGETTLVIAADHHIHDRLWPVLVSTLRRDAAAGEAAPFSGSLEIIPVEKETPGPAFPNRIEVELLGRCDARWNRIPLHEDGPLGWVLETSGKIPPIIYVDCGRVNEAIAPQTSSMPRDQWLQATSEALSHIILHEWTHIATQSSAHAKSGIMQSNLSIQELLAPFPPIPNAELPLHNRLQARDAQKRSARGQSLEQAHGT